MMEYSSTQLFIPDKWVLPFYFIVLPFMTITAILSRTMLVVYCVLLAIISIYLTIIGK